MADKELTVTDKGATFKIAGNTAEEISQWNTTPEQAEKHIPTWSQAELGARKISKGEESAIKDAANEYKKQRNS